MKIINIHLLIALLGLAIISLLSCRPSSGKTITKPSGDPLEKLSIEYIAHASFVISYKDHSLLLDPYADSVWISYDFPKEIDVDAIFSTHPHYDHDGGIFRNLKPYWEGKFPFYQDPGDYEIGDFKIKGIEGKHCDPYGKEFDQKNTIFIFEVGDIRLAHWGDNSPIDERLALALNDIDILMMPIDDTYHILSEEETQNVIERINPKIIIPMHYKIAELEPIPGRPKNLGTIEKYLQQHGPVVRLESNTFGFHRDMIPENTQYYVFKHSPLIPSP